MIQVEFLMNKWIFYFILICTSAYSQDDLDRNAFEPEQVEEQLASPDFQEDQVDGERDDQVQEMTVDSSQQNNQPEAPVVENPEMNEAPLPGEGFESGTVDFPGDENLVEKIRGLNPGSSAVQERYFPEFIYDEKGRKDPFLPVQAGRQGAPRSLVDEAKKNAPMEGILQYDTTALTVTAILLSKNTKPKALVKDPTNTIYTVYEKDPIGRNNGIVEKIREGEIIVVESRDVRDGKKLYTTQIMTIGN